MPLFYDEATVRAHYKQHQSQTVVGGVVQNPQPPLTYERSFPALLDQQSTRKDWLTGYGLDNNASVLCVGAGFGFLMEYLLDAGITDVWGLEPGSWYWDVANDGEWRADVKARVAQDSVESPTVVDSLNALGVGGQARFNWIVDEDAATCHSDAELPEFIAACEARLQGNARGRIVHIVSDRPAEFGPFGDPNLNAKTIVEWSLVAPDHSWVSSRDGSVWRGGSQVQF